jgi:hypothetical protein
VVGGDLNSQPGSGFGKLEGRPNVDPQSSNLARQVRCSRCQREPRDDADYVTWHALEDGTACPGCLTMLEAAEHRVHE